MMFMTRTMQFVPMAAPERDEGVMPWIAMVAAAVLKVSPRPVDSLVSRSSERWRGPKFTVHLYHVCFEAGLMSHYGRSLGK